MKVFVVNCGSSSIKYQLFDMADESVIAKGILERVGTEDAVLHLSADGLEQPEIAVGAEGGGDHRAGLRTILKILVERQIVASAAEIDAVGHRVVHGGETITESTMIDQAVLEVIRANCELAPLHNPPNLAGIEAAMEAIPDVPHVAVFDTTFLITLPPKAYRYAVPEHWYAKYHVRKYGFHGTSHRYVTLRAAELLGKKTHEVDLITVHLGNGCSITAVAGGKAVDHSMGFTPLEGLVMGTRSGDVDAGVVLHMAATGMGFEEIDNALNKESGLLGVSTRSNDMRDLLAAIEKGDEKAELAVELFVYRVVKYIGAYYTILPALDAVVLTGGIGENSPPVRAKICRDLSRLGVVFDQRRNEEVSAGRTGPISAEHSPLAVWVVPTNEELMIARDAQSVAKLVQERDQRS